MSEMSKLSKFDAPGIVWERRKEKLKKSLPLLEI